MKPVETSRGWVWARFRANLEDYRPVTVPPPGPWWCTGYGDDYAVIVAYVREGDDVRKWWPEASEVDTELAPDGPKFTDRFPRPDWWTGDDES